MNKKYLKENNLYEAHKQFMRLCEFTYVPSSLEEDDEQDMNNDPMMGGDMGGQQPMNDPMMGGEQQQPMDDPMMGNDMGMDDMPPMDNPMMGEEENEEVIDVEELTNAQEKMNDKGNLVGQNLEGFDSKLEALMQSINKIEDKSTIL